MHVRTQKSGLRGSLWVGMVVAVAVGLAACSNSATPASPRANASPSERISTHSSPPPSLTVEKRPSSGCTSPAIAKPGQTTVGLEVGADRGSYIRDVPGSYNGRQPMPVVVDLHGYAEPASVHAVTTRMGSFGDTHGFITVTPTTNAPVPIWSTAVNGPDVAFIGGLLNRLEDTMCVDRNRIFVTGHSNGAMMTSALACKFGDRIAAVAPVSGISEIAGCSFSRPVPVVTFHGTADPFLPYNGGIGPAVRKLPAADGSGRTLGQADTNNIKPGPSIPETTAAWAKRNHCSTATSNKQIGRDVLKISYHCLANADVELYRISGGGHTWPGSEFDKKLTSYLGGVTFTISADAVMWSFFQAHPLQTAS
jgi:polyhydroxybutyrate depolymerase